MAKGHEEETEIRRLMDHAYSNAHKWRALAAQPGAEKGGALAGNASAELNRLRAQATALKQAREALGGIEWIYDSDRDGSYCPACACWEDKHAADCSLNKAIAAIDAACGEGGDAAGRD
jgi:hypothetical protein